MSESVTQLRDVRGKKRVTDAADFVVIGTGAAGATAARVLSAGGAEVVMVEEGPRIEREDLRSDMWTSFKHAWRDLGFQTAAGRAFTPILQGRCVGGTTAINGAIIHRLPERVWQAWRDDFGLGDALPFRELERIFDQLDRELFVGPAPEAVLGENSALMRRATEAAGIGGNLIRRNVDGCRGSAHCNQGCPTGRRQSMDVSFVPRALDEGARLYATCAATGLARRRGRASGVEGRFRDPLTGELGPSIFVEARKGVILAASAIQTPVFLWKSGIGRGSGALGERLQAHPGTAVVGVFDRPVDLWRGATQGYESTHYWDERMKFETVAMPLELTAARLPSLGPELMRDLAQAGQLAIWGVQIRAEAHGRVRPGLFGGARIAYDMTDRDVGRLKLGIRRLVELMFAAGAREVLPGVHGLPARIRSLDELRALERLPDDPSMFHCIAAHLFGTALMAGSSFSSVVGPDFQAHDLPGLFVLDSSVFPTNLGVNPQHSISALAWLASERML